VLPSLERSKLTEKPSREDHSDRRRRRSRSPRNSSRRDYEVDTYSSSRDYREREREDTYARRERRDDRGWGGERGDRGGGDSYARRDRPRREDDRSHGGRRGDRDAFDDRGGGGGGRGRRERNDRDGGAFGGRDRKKSASPPPKKREPTPDLTNVVSILQRQRRLTQWDIRPTGYDNITAEQAKLSGMFPLPGAPRAAPMDPSKLAAFVSPSAGSASAAGLKPSNARQAKRLFIYNIPANASSESLMDFFNLQLNGLNVVSGNDPCISAQVSADREYALLEFKQPEDATMALALDGIAVEDERLGGPDRPGLSIRRPKDYIVPDAAEESTDYVEGELSSVVKDSHNKLSISNIPPFVDDAQIKELLEAFGPLKAMVLVKYTSSDQPRVSYALTLT
jgi:splicing factor U2AF subunit